MQMFQDTEVQMDISGYQWVRCRRVSTAAVLTHHQLLPYELSA